MDTQNTVNCGHCQPGTPNTYSRQVKDPLAGEAIELIPEMIERVCQTTPARDMNGTSISRPV